MIKCEKCFKQIGTRTQATKTVKATASYDSAVICKVCGAEFCTVCADEMSKCYCCGKPKKFERAK